MRHVIGINSLLSSHVVWILSAIKPIKMNQMIIIIVKIKTAFEPCNRFKTNKPKRN
jgi:hypothetical protein